MQIKGGHWNNEFTELFYLKLTKIFISSSTFWQRDKITLLDLLAVPVSRKILQWLEMV